MWSDRDCCGAHENCEIGLKKRELDGLDDLYFADEELDDYHHIPSDAYTAEQLDVFRDVLSTLRQNELSDWLLSLEKREINFPDVLKQEIF
ncbi:hypothetical protein FACS1894199_13460 [Bacteroidia bacterium]|nr:hypothetical protein FACS1894199_13460 [Bacteroidia bacterium]